MAFTARVSLVLFLLFLLCLSSSLTVFHSRLLVYVHVPVDVKANSSDGSTKEAPSQLVPPKRPPPPPDFGPVKSLSYNPFWLVLSKSKNVSITIVPKVMCSSIRDALNHDIEHCNPTRNHGGRCAEVRRNWQLNAIDLTNYARVVMVRDPFERALSAYQNSDVNPYIRLSNCQNTTNCTFPEWVDEIVSDFRSAAKNEHFQEMRDIIQAEKMHYNYYLRLSSPADQHFFWHQLLGLNHTLVSNKSSGTESKPSTKSKSRKLYETMRDNGTIEKLATVYKRDLELWQEVLDSGTPAGANERTVYDYYLESLL